jgi:uncharacterized protein YkwD
VGVPAQEDPANQGVVDDGTPAPLADKTNFTDADIALTLANHNDVRKAVKVEAMVWNDLLARYAQAWANEIATNRNCDVKHRPNEGKWQRVYGENMYASSHKSPLEDGLKYWIDQKQHYTGAVISETMGEQIIGNYTQVVWADTKEVGCGKAECSNRLVVIVCNYNPPGNIIGEKPYE